MGVPVGEADGEFAVELTCVACEGTFETDETMPNDCPECGRLSYTAA